MANVTAKCTLLLGNGTVVDMASTVAEGSTQELLTSTTYAVAATSLGTFADGQVIAQVLNPVSAPNGISYAYINRRGSIACILPVAVEGQVLSTGGALGFRLEAGDTLQVLALTSASRAAAYCVKTAQGTSAIFAVTPSGAANNDMSHILTSQSLGSSLQNQVITSHFCTSKDGSNLSTGGVMHLNDRSLPISACPAINPQAQQPSFLMGGAPVALNHVARLQTSA